MNQVRGDLTLASLSPSAAWKKLLSAEGENGCLKGD